MSSMDKEQNPRNAKKGFQPLTITLPPASSFQAPRPPKGRAVRQTEDTQPPQLPQTPQTPKSKTRPPPKAQPREPKPQPELPALPSVILSPDSGRLPVTDEPLPVEPLANLTDRPDGGMVAAHEVPRRVLEDFIRRNPHCAQVATDLVRPYFGPKDFADRPLETLPTVMTPESPTMPFVDRPDEDRSTLHDGQLKLWMSEMVYLMKYTGACSGTKTIVVYAGAAPGHHIPSLATSLPACQFLLYDPAPFCRALCGPNVPANVTVHHKTFFTEDIAAELAKQYEGVPLVFISDIRTGKEEEYVETDMVRQKEWVRILRPLASMLKFRLPWQAGKTPYLDGEIFLPVFGPLTSTECRLVTTQGLLDQPEKEYDNKTYEETCAYHNTVGRVRTYAHEVQAPGLDKCHDCSMLVSVVGEYLRRCGKEVTPAAISEFIAAVFRSFDMRRDLSSKHARSSNRSGRQWPERSYAGDRFQQRPSRRRDEKPGKRSAAPPTKGAAPAPRDETVPAETEKKEEH